MTNYKSLSGLSIAAIAFLATAAPSFSQAKADQPSANTQNLQTVVIEQTLAVNRGMILPAIIPSATPAPTTKPVTLSASSFEVKNQFMAPAGGRFTNQLNLNPASADFSGRKQYKVDDEGATATSTRKITFVPSRGLKLPQ